MRRFFIQIKVEIALNIGIITLFRILPMFLEDETNLFTFIQQSLFSASSTNLENWAPNGYRHFCFKVHSCGINKLS